MQLDLFTPQPTRLSVIWWVRIQTTKQYYSKYRVWSNENLTEKIQQFKDNYKEKILWYHATPCHNV